MSGCKAFSGSSHAFFALFLLLFYGLPSVKAAEPSSASVETLQRDKGFSQTRSTKAALEESAQPRRYALVVGINVYQDKTWGSLKHAVNDARAVAEVLEDPALGRFDHVVLLEGQGEGRGEGQGAGAGRTSRAALLAELRRMKNELRKQDTFVLYFSGHGTADTSPEGSRYYLVASDTKANNLWETGIELTTLMGFLSEFKTSRSVAIFDSCFAGEGKSGLSAQAKAQLGALPNPWAKLTQAIERSDAILMATAPGGVAQEDDRLGHGIFTYSLLEALRGQQEGQQDADTNRDGAVTPYEVHDFARVLASQLSKGTQAPEGFFRVTGKGELYLVGEPDPKRSPQTRIYAYGARLQKGLSLKVDGRTRGAFPRTVAVPSGVRMVEVQNEQAQTLARGRLELLPGEVLELDTLLERLKMPVWGLDLQGGNEAQFLGPAVALWGSQKPRMVLGGLGRARGGTFAGTQLRLELGWQGIDQGLWRTISPAVSRNRLDVGLELTHLRTFKLGGGAWQKPVRLGSGLAVRGVYLQDVPVTDATAASPSALASAQAYTWIEGGPVFWQSLVLQDRLAVVLRESATVLQTPLGLQGSSPSSFLDLSVLGQVMVGVELGF